MPGSPDWRKQTRAAMAKAATEAALAAGVGVGAGTVEFHYRPLGRCRLSA